MKIYQVMLTVHNIIRSHTLPAFMSCVQVIAIRACASASRQASQKKTILWFIKIKIRSRMNVNNELAYRVLAPSMLARIQ